MNAAQGALQEAQVAEDLLGLQGPQVTEDNRDLLEREASLVHLAHLGPLDLQGQLGSLGKEEAQAQLGLQDLEDLQGHLDLRERLVNLVNLDLPDQEDLMDQVAHLGLLVRQEKMDRQDLRAHRALGAQLVLPVALVREAAGALLDHLVPVEWAVLLREENQDPQDLQAQTDSQDHPDQLD